jgi:hypothetical protein
MKRKGMGIKYKIIPKPLKMYIYHKKIGTVSEKISLIRKLVISFLA